MLDARSERGLGGTGEALPWSDLAVDLARDRGSAAVVLAGGLKPDNVASAVRTLAPDVVDVSSGVEASPGMKDRAADARVLRRRDWRAARTSMATETRDPLRRIRRTIRAGDAHPRARRARLGVRRMPCAIPRFRPSSTDC